jgi:hypothetical protein
MVREKYRTQTSQGVKYETSRRMQRSKKIVTQKMRRATRVGTTSAKMKVE